MNFPVKSRNCGSTEYNRKVATRQAMDKATPIGYTHSSKTIPTSILTSKQTVAN